MLENFRANVLKHNIMSFHNSIHGNKQIRTSVSGDSVFSGNIICNQKTNKMHVLLTMYW